MTDKEIKEMFKQFPQTKLFEYFPKTAQFYKKLYLYEKTIKKPL